MHPYLKIRRRMLDKALRRYALADAAWRRGLEQAALLVPGAMGRGHVMIGNPGSRVRRLYDERDRALQRLAAARTKLHEARRRIRPERRILLITLG
ncbi:hypothetical protein [Ruegeria marina]|uniref:Uncharacterized protein n=1 Tax=Ruegeria marina TaxID=639004 RepID=A0A1G6N5G0_9RHOB|nr:hypothetical protein [Ruegeria marina]SDC62647.1 hypothetical protein SAMN04488239_10332 [Ruegeria marina]